MTKREWIRALIAQRPVWRRPVWPAACALLILALFVLAFSNQRHWQHRAAALERENLKLQLEQLAREVSRESDQLVERARDLAESEAIAQLMQDNAAAPPDRSALVHLTRHTVDSLVVVSASQVVR